ncbi:MAG TPA: SDR family NAD(P)-dependent oxidoreductase [Chitinophaga sp.]|uniref:SDR family NAD(P)-dependent oxidoreductase n=1 Tax=Chitinophaga sp. TaxID=1869181 RepID=UPI002CC8ECB4|nr:SDR family NAD(P)-dependent oxidoreductase [Chitinophaga sp.]HVI46024.1 SDR family NAD(P)-dependent oxidoreductase [Chitinophaga sp.]
MLAGGSADLADKLKEKLAQEVLSVPESAPVDYFVKVLEKVKEKLREKEATHITVVCSHGDYLDYGFISGLLKSATQENPKVTGKVVVVDSLSVHDLEMLSGILEAEQYTGDTEVRYLGGKRCVKQLHTIAATESMPDNIVIKEGGVYLLTGGAGGLGQVFAGYISQTANTQLILTGRGELTAEKQAALSAFPNAVYYPCDVSKAEEVTALIARIRTRYTKLDGIIHSAGVIRDSFILNKTREEALAVMLPKMAGARNLDEATKGDALDFMVFFSSVAGVLGNVGQSDYASANAWLDNYAHYRNEERLKGRRKGQTLSINWPLWKVGGMRIDAASEAYLEKEWGMQPLPVAAGIQAFETLLSSKVGQGVVVYGKAHEIVTHFTQAHKEEKNTPPSFIPDNAETERWRTIATDYIRKLLAKELKISAHRFEADIPFAKYGIDSILITKLNSCLEDVFGRLPRTLFFEYQTLDELTGYFIAEHYNKLAVITGYSQETSVPRAVTNNFILSPDNGQQPVVDKKTKGNAIALSGMTTEEIAIIGISGRYPGAKNINEFWENLKAGKDSITEIPRERWDINNFYSEEKGKIGSSYSKWGGFIDGVDQFDPLFFNISPREAELIDPQERLFLQTVWETIEDAGYTREALQGVRSSKIELGGRVGVYVGVMYEEYQLFGVAETLRGNPVSLWGNPGSIANRVSYFFNFHGPSMAVDTMCSSSLTAIHLACESIQNGSCDLAIAGGVNVSIHPGKYLALSENGFVSAKGRCESFGEGGDGYVPGEGVGAILLKPLSQAVADGDRIYGVIKGSAVNHGGRANGYTVPNPKAQTAVIKEAIRKAGVKAADFSYIEAHGTGTSLGDPIEIAGLTKAFSVDNGGQYCSIGSVKSNIGHCESAAGISGITKVLLQLKHQQLVPSLHAATLNPNIDFASTPFKVQRMLEEWTTADDRLRLAGISGFGAGGSNAHIVIGEYRANKTAYTSAMPVIIVLSARNLTRLNEQVINLKHFLETHADVNLYDVAYTLQVGREAMEERLALIVSDQETLLDKLSGYEAGEMDNIFTGNTKKSKPGFLLEGNAGKAYIESALRDRENGAIAQLWVSGVGIDWNLLYDGHKPEKISLPTYPFARNRYWVPAERISTAGEPASATAFATHLYSTDWEESLPELTEKHDIAISQLILLAGCSAVVADKLQAMLEQEVVLLPIADEITYFIHTLEKVKAQLTTKTAIHISVVCSNKEYLAYGFVSGLLKTATQENPKVTGKIIGVESIGVSEVAMLAGILKKEKYNGDAEVSYQAGKRMIKVTRPITCGADTKADLPVKEGGVYLITGGTGGLGQIFAGYISETPNTQLILTGSSALTVEKQVLLSAFPNAVYYRCNVSSATEVTDLIATIKTRYTRIDGIIHSAGVIRDSFIVNKTAEEATAVLLPKIAGAKNLDEATKEEALDFMVFFSSVAGVFGNAGQADYASANAWLDNYAHFRNAEQVKGNRKGSTRSINWPLWKAGGMQIAAESEAYLERKWGMLSLPTAAGIRAFEVLLTNPGNQGMVIFGDRDNIAEKLFSRPVRDHITSSSGIHSADLQVSVTKKILEIAADLLKLRVTDLATDERLGDYGFDSISLTRFCNELNNYYDLDLKPTLFYNYSTVEGLTTFLIEEYVDNLVKKHPVIRRAEQIARIPAETITHPLTATGKTIPPSGPIPSHIGGPVAIIGMSGRFPESPDLAAFWNNLRDNKDLIVEIPAERWDWKKYDGDPRKEKNKTRAKWGGFIAGADKFDPLFFNISPKEAELMDPQQRITLETVYHALEDAGINVKELSGSNTGVFIGAYFNDYAALIQRGNAIQEAQSATGISHSILTNRISYQFNLHGPSEPVDTACSSSLVAIHRAVEHIRNGACDIVIAGGVSLDLIPETLLPLSQAGMLSEDGRCRTFDQAANGYVRGEGVGIVILKSLSKAEADGDHIYGVIRGTAENHGGKANTLTSPNPAAQKDLLLSAYRSANIDPRAVSYIETHGTGTPLGDPIETEGLKLAFKELYKEWDIPQPEIPYCGLGSVKTNIGHLEAAAGIAGVMKVLLSLQHRTLPGNPHLQTPNAYLKLEGSPFRLQRETEEWLPVNNLPRIAGISSFGFGGSNAHVIIEEYQPPERVDYTGTAPVIITLSARNEHRLKELAVNLKRYLETDKETNLYDIAYTLQTGREQMEERLALIAENKERLEVLLNGYLVGITPESFANTVFTGSTKKDKLELLLKGGAGHAYISYAIANKELASIAQLWVKGGDIDWSLLYDHQKPAKISLPTYPFARERYWVMEEEGPMVSRSNNKLHPLLHSNESDLYEQKFISIYTGTETFLADHVVRGEKVFPGVAYLELANAAGNRSTRQPVTTFKNVTWQQPVYVNDVPQKVHISIYPAGEEVGYEIYTQNETTIQIHSEGKLTTKIQPAIGKQDLVAIRKRLTHRKEGEACYAVFREMGINYGVSFRGIEELYYSESEALSKITLPSEADYVLSPGVLDSALQTCIGLSFTKGRPDLLLPFSVHEVNIYQELPPTVWGYVRKSRQHDTGSKVTYYDIDLLNADGEVLIRFTELVMLPLDKFSTRNQPEEKAATFLYSSAWQPAPQPVPTRQDAEHLILLGGGTSDLADKLKEALELEVAILSEDTATSCFISALEKVKEKLVTKRATHITVLCSNADYADYGFISGLLKTAAQENPKVTGKIIGVPRLNIQELNVLTAILEAEQYTSDTEVRYEDGIRTIKAVSAITGVADGMDNPLVKEGGVYLITGGAGGLGQIFAKYISSVSNTQVILTGRSTLTREKQTALSALSNVVYYECDISNKTALTALIKAIKARYQKLDGIIHAAGIIRDSFIINKTPEEAIAVLLPKITGTKNLDEATREEKLDFMVFFSAVAGVMGNIGQADYAAANAWMDNYAYYRHTEQTKGRRQGKTLSISWPLWQEGGMRIDEQGEKYLQKKWGMLPLPTEEGIKAFNALLSNVVGQGVVVHGRSSMITTLFTGKLIEDKTMLSSSVPEDGEQEMLQAASASYIRRLLSKELRLPEERFELNAPFEQYGINSVLITRLTNCLDEVFDKLPRTLFFEYQTLGELIGYFINEHGNRLRELTANPERLIGPAIADAAGNPERIIHNRQRHRFAGIKPPVTLPAVPEDIAIIGLSGRYPGAKNIDEFWENLKAGKDSITEIPPDRWDITDFYSEDRGDKSKSYSKWGGFMDDIDQFDPLFFNISPREAIMMDPQERLFLQTVWETIEDAGYTRELLQGTRNDSAELGGRVGVYAGVMYEEYQLFGAEETLKGNPLTLLGNPSGIANRVSYFFNFHGPSMAVDTMCSSSLTAIHLACKDIHTGETDLAIAGGVNVSVHPRKYVMLSQGSFVSGKGRCESFGVGGDGYVPGEGVGAVLLKSLSKAIADGDRIYGVIKGTAVNHGGKTNGYTVPNPKAQAAVIKEAIRKAGVAATDFSYIEAHGTGTSLGDPIEMAGLTKAFASDKKQYCSIGSVKSNIGHCESAAGISGLTKVLLQLKHQQLVPSLHAATLNPHIDFTATPFKVQQQLETWTTPDNRPRLSGISSFGAGGSNAHVIIEEYCVPQKNAYTSTAPAIIVLSARDTARLRQQAANLKHYVEVNHPVNLYDIAYTLQVGREAMEERLAFLAKDKAELLNKLTDYLAGTTTGLVAGNAKTGAADLLSAGDMEIAAARDRADIDTGFMLHLWVKGIRIDWMQLYPDQHPDKIGLPAYPFARQRYWFDNIPFHSKGKMKENTLINTTGSSPEMAAIPDSFNLLSDKTMQPEKVRLLSVTDAIRLVKPEMAYDTREPLENISQPLPLPVPENKETVQSVMKKLEGIVSDTLYLDGGFDENRVFQELGLDSIVGVELMKNVNEQFGIQLNATKLYDYPTLKTLAGYITTQLVAYPEKEGLKVTVTATKDTISLINPVVENVGVPPVAPRPDKHTEEQIILVQLSEILRNTLYLDDDFDESKAFQELGLDSIVGVELIKNINERFNIQLNATKLYDYPTLKTLTGYVVTQLPVHTAALALAGHDKAPVETIIPSSPLMADAVVDQTPVKERDSRIAIIGMSGRYPMAQDLAAYWDNISKGVDCVSEISKDRWNVDEYYVKGGETTGSLYAKWLGQLDDVDKFDPLFFNISPSEAELMDPQQRIFLEECWKSLEDAGYSRSKLDGMKCGTYVGIMGNEYAYLVKQSGFNQYSSQLMTGNAGSIFAARMAYFLNLKGPAIAIDTACSSSLVAIHLACQALLNEEIDMAIAGGVTLYLGVEAYQQMCAAGMLSKEGKCKTFDNSADGFVPGEGAGVLVLKRLSDALRDGDHIDGVILGSGINQDGKTNGITAPSVNAQADLLTGIYRKYDIDPETITYVEAHGTGTKLGDPIEVEALTTAFGAFTSRKEYCGIGSVKSNIGHTSAAAGVASICKVLLQFRHASIAPSLHYINENEYINLKQSPFYVNTTLKHWNTAPGQLKRAAVSSFGFSGTNAHLVLEEYPSQLPVAYIGEASAIILLSAKNESILLQQAANLKAYLTSDADHNLDSIAYTLQTGRTSMEERLAIVAKDKTALIDKLTAFLAGNKENVLTNNVNKNKTVLIPDAASVENALSDSNSVLLAELWIKGAADINWSSLYRGQYPHRISLPVYPFAKERYWIPVETSSKITANGGKLHPLLHLNTSSPEQQQFTSVYTGKESFLADHKVKEEKVLPGVAYLELARAAGEQSSAEKITQLRDIAWLQPIGINGKSKEIHIRLSPSDGEISYEVYTQNNKEQHVHSRGRLNAKVQQSVTGYDLSAIRNRLIGVKGGKECYQLFNELGLHYGATFQGIEKIYFSEQEALSRIVLSKETGYVLSPGILDSALQTCAGIDFTQKEPKLALPLSVREVNLYRDLPSVIWSYARKSNNDRANSKVTHYDIDLLDDHGGVLLSFKDFATLSINTEERQPVSHSPLDNVVVNEPGMLFVPAWNRVKAAVASTLPVGGKHLIVTGNTEVALAGLLKEVLIAGNGEVIIVKGLNEVPPDITDVYLLQGISATPPGATLEQEHEQRELSVFKTVKTLLATTYREKRINITAITGNTQKVLATDLVSEHGSGIVGLIGSLAKEQPHWRIRVIDMEAQKTSRADIEKLLLCPFDKEDPVSGCRNGFFYQKDLYELELSRCPSSKFRAQGVYVILGGAGGIGRVTTEYLVRNYKAQVIWLGRSPLDDKIMMSQAAIEKLGVKPIYIQCDANKRGSVENAYREIKKMKKPVHGLFHSAIVLNDKLIMNMSEDGFERSFAPKSLASHYFVETFKEEPLDFICFYSSVQSQWNAAGQGNYAAGCTYKDSYAHRLKHTMHTPVYIINWGYWGEVGVVSADDYKVRMELNGVGSISSVEGMNILEMVLANKPNQVIAIKFI